MITTGRPVSRSVVPARAARALVLLHLIPDPGRRARLVLTLDRHSVSQHHEASGPARACRDPGGAEPARPVRRRVGRARHLDQAALRLRLLSQPDARPAGHRRDRLARGRSRGRRAGGRSPLQLGQHPPQPGQRRPGARHPRRRRAGVRGGRGRPDRPAAPGLDHARGRRRPARLAAHVEQRTAATRGTSARPSPPATAATSSARGGAARRCCSRGGCRSARWPGPCSSTRARCATTWWRRSPAAAEPLRAPR